MVSFITATRAIARRPLGIATVARRNMSGDAEHAIEEMFKWRKFTYGMCGLTAVIGVWVATTQGHHHVDHTEPQPTHMKIRNKPYPWMCSDCNFLDMKCFEECKASRA